MFQMSPIRMVTAPPSTRDYVSVKLTDQGYLLYLSKFLAPCLHTAVKPMWRDMLKDSLGVKDSHVSFLIGTNFILVDMSNI